MINACRIAYCKLKFRVPGSIARSLRLYATAAAVLPVCTASGDACMKWHNDIQYYYWKRMQ